MYSEVTVIYADILFLINFSLDFLCLFITGRILNCGGKEKRLLLGSLLGAAYSFVPYFFSLSVFVSLPLHIASAGLITFVSFGKRETKKFILLWGTFIVSSALLGGLITSIYSLTGEYHQGPYRETDIMTFCLICVVSALVALAYGLIFRKRINITSAEIRVHCKGDKFDIRLLADSGNLVTEPFSALPVIIAASSALPYPYDSPESEAFPFHLRAIPFKTASGGGCILGFRPDRIEIRLLGKKPKIIDAYIGIDTQNKSFSGYDGIIPSSLF